MRIKSLIFGLPSSKIQTKPWQLSYRERLTALDNVDSVSFSHLLEFIVANCYDFQISSFYPLGSKSSCFTILAEIHRRSAISEIMFFPDCTGVANALLVRVKIFAGGFTCRTIYPRDVLRFRNVSFP